MSPPGWLQAEGCKGKAAACKAPCTCCWQNLFRLRCNGLQARSLRPRSSAQEEEQLLQRWFLTKTRALFCSASACGGGKACFHLRSAILHRKQHASFPSSAKQQSCAKNSFPCELGTAQAAAPRGTQPVAPGCGRTGAVGAVSWSADTDDQSQINRQQGWQLLLSAISGVKPP